MKIIDFGEAFLLREHRKELYTPLAFRAPESFFNEAVGTSADIWAFGCTVYDFFGHYHLFNTYMPSPQSIMLEIISVLGPIPSIWRGKDRIPSDSPFFHIINDSVVTSNQNRSKPLASCIQGMRSFVSHSQRDSKSPLPEPFISETAANLEKLLTACLKYVPAERITAQELVELKWLQESLKGEALQMGIC